MLISDLNTIGNNLYKIRKLRGLTQSEVAELSELSDRAYADIERGTVKMRIETILRICKALHITSDAILTEDNYSFSEKREEIITLLDSCSLQEQETALQLLAVYLNSLK